jgi:hypothetical protein
MENENDIKEVVIKVKSDLTRLSGVIAELESLFKSKFLYKEVSILDIDSFFSELYVNRETSFQEIFTYKKCHYNGVFSVMLSFKTVRHSLEQIAHVTIKEVDFKLF